MKAVLLTIGSLALTAGVIGNAYMQKRQFYPSVVYITKSNPSMAVLYIQAFVMVILMGKLMRKIFFGQLRAAEMEHLIERSWYAVTETCLAFTVFREEFSPRFVGLFTLLLFLKCFHWLAEDRVDYMERSPMISVIFHVRVISLLAFLGLLDIYFINHAYYSTLLKGASVQLVFGFEYAILFTMVLTVLVKYSLHTIDLQSENPWLNKAVYMLYTDLVLGFVKVALYMLFLAIMIKVHTFPLFAIRPMYLTMRSFKKALNDVIMSRRAIRNMNTLYEDATEEELQAGDNVCIICREVMALGSKKLPCNHIFHTACLRSWFLRQQTCPTCRMDVLRPATRRQQSQQQQQQQPVPQQQNQQPNPFFPGFPGMFPGAVWPPQQPPPPTTLADASDTSAAATTPTFTPSTTLPAGGVPVSDSTTSGVQFPFPSAMPPFMMMPPFGMMPPFSMPPPPMPPADFSGLTEAELHAMEGMERQNVEARVQCLRQIQTLLDAAVLQMQQYSNIVNELNTNRTTVPSSVVSSQQRSSVSSPVTSTTSSGSSKSTHASTFTTPSISSPITTPFVTTTPGVKPKTTPNTSTVVSEPSDHSELEGAVGYTPPKEEMIPKWTDPSEEIESEDSIKEIRKRRLQKFSSMNSESVQDSRKNEDTDL